MLNNRFSTKFRCSRGATLPEYTLLLSLILVVALPAVQLVSKGSRQTFETVGDAFENQPGFFIVAGGPDGLTAQSQHSSDGQQAASSPGKGEGSECGGGTTSDCVLTSTTEAHPGDAPPPPPPPANGSGKK